MNGRSTLWAGLSGLVLAPLLLVGSALAQSDEDEREKPEVKKLIIEGVHAVDRSQLAKSIATQASSCRSLVVQPFCLFTKSKLFFQKQYLDHTEFMRDVLRIKVFYFKRGYRETQVDTAVSRKGDGVQVAFRIKEGPPTLVSSVTVVRPETILTAKDLRKTMRLRAGEPFNLLDLDSSRVLLRNRLWDKGYADAILKDTAVVNDSLRTAVVRMNIDPRWRASIESVTVIGNEKVSRRTIGNMITLKPGGVYRRSDVIASQRNLYASNLFQHAVIIIPPRGDTAKLVDITVQEAPPREARVSAGFNTFDFFQTEGRFTHYNWLGGGKRLDLRLVVGNILAPALNGIGIFRDVTANFDLTDEQAKPYLRLTYQASADVTQPWFRDPRNTLGASLFSHRSSAPGIFIDKGYGASVSFTRQVATRSPVSLVYRYELTQVQAADVYFCVNYGVCTTPSINLLRNRQALSPLALSFFADRSNDPLNPSSGFQARLDLEHASRFTLSDFRYNRMSGEASYYLPLGRAVLAARVTGGWVKSLRTAGDSIGTTGNITELIIHPRERFYAGGSQSVRGYGENQLGPRILTVDPLKLIERAVSPTDTTVVVSCTPETVTNGTCDPNFLNSDDFQPRPTGGTALIGANVEYRVPIWGALSGALFVDGAYVGEGSLRSVTQGTGAITPGFGVRYLSPAGPIRVDIGIRPKLSERLTVITQVPDTNSQGQLIGALVQLRTPKLYDPLEGKGGIKRVLARLTLHLSIGQAF